MYVAIKHKPLDRYATHIDWELGRTTGMLLDWIKKSSFHFQTKLGFQTTLEQE